MTAQRLRGLALAALLGAPTIVRADEPGVLAVASCERAGDREFRITLT